MGNEVWVPEVFHIGVVISVYSQITSLSWSCHFSLWKEFWFVFIFNYSFCSTERFTNSIICEVDFCTWLAKQRIFLSQDSSLYACSLWESLHVLNTVVKHNSTSFNIVWEPVDLGCLICFFIFFFIIPSLFSICLAQSVCILGKSTHLCIILNIHSSKTVV